MNKESKTTTVGLVIKDYVVLAADKRATAGVAVYHKNVKKIARITDRAALTISGLVADAQFIVENAKYIVRDYEASTGKPITIKSLANVLSTILSSYLRVYPFIVQLLLGGYDDVEGPALYYLDLYGTITREKYMATGSGSPVAFGVLEASYKPDMVLEEAVNLAVKAVTAALTRDGFSGEGVDVLAIGKGGVTLEKTIQIKKTLISS
jgi:proteasome endopeptidase complex, beta component (EC 3.4.25.1). Threonine peptidase. MEROPS family T01A